MNQNCYVTKRISPHPSPLLTVKATHQGNLFVRDKVKCYSRINNFGPLVTCGNGHHLNFIQPHHMYNVHQK